MSMEFPNIKKPNEENVNFRNKERSKKVESREGKPKYYTALDSRHIKYKVGDIITGIAHNSQFEKPSVFLTNSEKPHWTLKDRGEDLGEYIVYRVVPIGKVKQSNFWREMAASSVRVVEIIGSAEGFFKKDQYSMPYLVPHIWRFDKEKSKYPQPNEEGKKLLEKINKKHGLR